MFIFQRLFLTGLFSVMLIQAMASDHEGAISFNKVADDFVTMSVYENDPEAEAVILSHTGQAKFDFSENDGFFITYKIHKVIKVLKKSGTSQADMEIPYYVFSNKKEVVSSIKGFVYNEENGKINKTKLTKENIFDEQTSKTYRKKKISSPNVKEGSVIEISYEIKSELFNYLREWEFQSEIPTRWSEYSVTYPEYFSYAQINQGYIPYKLQEKKEGMGTIFLSRQNSNGKDAHTYQTTDLHWIGENMPALRPEPFVDNPAGYATKVEFQLKWVQFPQSLRKDVAASWNAMGDELLKDEDFGKLLEKGKFANKIVEGIVGGLDNPDEKIIAIVSHLNDKVKWNGRQTIYPSRTPEKSYNEGDGNVADLNFLLIIFLRAAGIEAHPLVSSTRNIGYLNPSNPVMYKLNHVSAWVYIDGKELVLDITDSTLPLGFLPVHIINFNGWLVASHNSKWVTLNNSNISSDITLNNIQIMDGLLNAEVSHSHSGYTATSKRKNLFNNGKDNYIEKLEANLSNWEISDIEWGDILAKNEKFTEAYTLKGTQGLDVQGDFIYLSPLSDAYLSENPFKLDSRIFPIDFIYKQKKMMIINVKIPEGYAIEGLPESITSNLSDRGISYTYRCGINENKTEIQISLNYQVNTPFYTPDRYNEIRQLFDFISTKQKEFIVFKKI